MLLNSPQRHFCCDVTQGAVLTPERVHAILGHTPMARFGDPEELAGATLLLAGDAGRFITGAEIVVDGGFSAMTI